MILSGIYKILNLINGKLYIGSAVNFYKRWHQHEYELNKDNHTNKYLQSAWNKYGAENFEFIAIEGVKNLTKLIEREQFWINQTKCYDRKIGYNFRIIADSNLGTKATEETKIKMK